MRTTRSSRPSSKPVDRTCTGSLSRPEKSSSYILATRAGVSTNPSLDGSSPMASIMEATAACIFSLSIN